MKVVDNETNVKNNNNNSVLSSSSIKLTMNVTMIENKYGSYENNKDNIYLDTDISKQDILTNDYCRIKSLKSNYTKFNSCTSLDKVLEENDFLFNIQNQNKIIKIKRILSKANLKDIDNINYNKFSFLNLKNNLQSNHNNKSSIKQSINLKKNKKNTNIEYKNNRNNKKIDIKTNISNVTFETLVFKKNSNSKFTFANKLEKSKKFKIKDNEYFNKEENCFNISKFKFLDKNTKSMSYSNIKNNKNIIRVKNTYNSEKNKFSHLRNKYKVNAYMDITSLNNTIISK